jgi:hypothetical protein
MKSDKIEISASSISDPSASLPEESTALVRWMPVDDRRRPIFNLFENSIERLSPKDKITIVVQFQKPQPSFALLLKSFDEILRAEEEHRIFEQKMKIRQDT